MTRQDIITKIKKQQDFNKDKDSVVAMDYNVIDDYYKTKGSFYAHNSSRVEFKDILKNRLQPRYVKTEIPKKHKNIVIDSAFLSELIYNEKVTNEYLRNGNFLENNKDFKINPSYYAISSYIATILGVEKIPTMDICLMLGYDLKKIKSLLIKVRKKGLHLVNIGFGGFSRNFMYILKEISYLANEYKIFNNIYIFENDKIEFSNIWRFMDTDWIEACNAYNPYEPVLKYPINSLNGFMEYQTGNANYNSYEELRRKMIGAIDDTINYYAVNKTHNFSRFCNVLFKRKFQSLAKKNVFLRRELFDFDYINHDIANTAIFIGATDITTRERFFNSDLNFLCPIHHNKDMYLWSKPEVKNSIMVESYGLIDLNRFFISVYAITFKILEAIANDNIDKKDELLAHINLSEDELDFKKTSRKYHIKFSEMTNVFI